MPVTRMRRLCGATIAVLLIAVAAPASVVGAPPVDVPFSVESPFNRLAPHPAPVASNGGSLAGRTLSVGYSEYTPAVFVSSARDPEYTIRLTSGWGPNALNGMRVRIPSSARRADDSDGHLTIVVPDRDIVVSLYQAEQGPRSDGTWAASWGGIAPLSGTGANRSDSGGGRESGISQLAGLITPDDVRRGIAAGPGGDLGHALSMLHNRISNRTSIPPAIAAGGNSSDGLYMGQRVFLDPALDVDSLPFEGGEKERRFGRLVARTLQRYGAIVVSNSSATGFQLVNPASWTSIGQADPWPELIGQSRVGYYNFTVRAIPASRLRALDPSAGSGLLVPRPGAGPEAAPPPSSSSGPSRRSKARRKASALRRTARQLMINQRIGQAALRRLAVVEAAIEGRPAPTFRRRGGRDKVTLSAEQLLINQRIYQAGVRRGTVLEARLDRRPAPPAGARSGDIVRLTLAQLVVNQRIAQAAVRRANELLERVG